MTNIIDHPTTIPCPDWCQETERHVWETDKETGLPERYHERVFGPLVYIAQRERVVPMSPVILDAPLVRLSISELEEHSIDALREMVEQVAAAIVECERITGSPA